MARIARQTRKTRATPVTPAARRMRRRDDGDGGNRERDTGEGRERPPTFPDPWFPDISAHFYGLNWDLENLPAGNVQQQLTTAFQQAFPGRAVRAAFDPTYAGRDTTFSLSLGLWAGPPNPLFDAARRRGLLALRSTGNSAMSAEVLVALPLLRDAILQALPRQKTFPARSDIADLSVTIHLVGYSVSVIPPSTLHVTGSYSGELPLLGTATPSIQTNVTFGATNGNVTLTATPLNAGDFGAGDLILHNLHNPLGQAVIILGGITLGGFAISNLGSNLPALPGLPTPDLRGVTSLLPRDIPIDALKIALRYSTPTFVTRGASSGTLIGPGAVVGANPGLEVLRVPLAWDIVQRRPSLAVSGPSSALLVNGAGTVRYRATPSDLVSPIYAWAVDGVPLPGQAGASANLRLDAHSKRTGVRKTFVIAVRAMDGVVPQLTASASTTTIGVVGRDTSEEDPPGGYGGPVS
jgi:hypothetical protein